MNKADKHALGQKAIFETKQWIEKIIIAHNFCPFAKAPFNEDTIRYKVSNATNIDDVIDSLVDELLYLDEADPGDVETSLLILPRALADFEDYNQFLDVVDSALEELDLVDVIRVDSFHPDYCFANYESDDVRNYTNRSIYPMFHFLREDSVEHARATYPDVDAIPEKNMALLLEMGLDAIQNERKSCLKNQ